MSGLIGMVLRGVLGFVLLKFSHRHASPPGPGPGSGPTMAPRPSSPPALRQPHAGAMRGIGIARRAPGPGPAPRPPGAGDLGL